MKRLLRNVMMIAVGAMMTGAPMQSEAKTAKISELPAAAQQTIRDNFGGRKVAMSKSGTNMLFAKSYDVVFTNGDKVEFDRNGDWTEIQCKHSHVPAALVPQGIRDYMKRNYSDTSIKEIEKSGSKYEVTLSNGLEITFNKFLEVTDIDD